MNKASGSLGRVRLACLVVGILSSLFPCQSVAAGAQSPEPAESAQQAEETNPQYEYNVKAAFLYAFGRYVEWPKEAFDGQSGAFVLGVCGEDRFGRILERIAESKTIQGRRIVVEKMSTADQLPPCHILFVSRSLAPAEQTAIINKTRDKPILLVGESAGFAEQGGGINFFVESGTVRFEINVEAIRQKALVLDAKLLNLGKKVPAAEGNKSNGM
jgi:hypothetical protein